MLVNIYLLAVTREQEAETAGPQRTLGNSLLSLLKSRVRASQGVEKRFGLTALFFHIPAGSLCKRKSPECDKETSICTDLDGVALCQCKSGYFQFNKMDHSCRGSDNGGPQQL